MFGWGPGGRTGRQGDGQKGKEPCSNSNCLQRPRDGACRHGRVRPIGGGLEEYVQACASCHGIAGQGNGPLAEFMTVTVPDLTRISQANDGVFPMLQVIQIIDGRTGVRGHGSEMPVWGAATSDGDLPANGRIRCRAPGPGPHPCPRDTPGIHPGVTPRPRPVSPVGGTSHPVSRDDRASFRRSRHRARSRPSTSPPVLPHPPQRRRRRQERG
jgi:hypothetical protein